MPVAAHAAFQFMSHSAPLNMWSSVFVDDLHHIFKIKAFIIK